MKRQNSMVSSSSRRENPPEKIHAKTIGCMSGIIHFVCKSHNPRRFLTFGKKQIKNGTATAELPKQTSVTDAKTNNVTGNDPNPDMDPILSREVPRSPTIPPEIRRSNPVKSPENFRSTPPALLARLMGLEEGPAAAAKTESVAEKRDRLLSALQKCDEDLKALKKIIEAVRSVDQPGTASPSPAAAIVRSASTICLEDKIRTVSEVKCSEFKCEQQQPSPVSVLDEFTRSPLSFRGYSERHSHSNGRVVQQEKQQLQKKAGEENTYLYERMTLKKGKNEEEGEDEGSSVVMWSSKAMIESVEEVCREIAWGEKRETGRIGLALQDHICRDLIDEIITDFGCYCFYTTSTSNLPPFEACKRRLAF